MKKILSLIIAFSLVLSSFIVVSAGQDSPTISVSNVKMVRGRTVDVEISISGNPGISAMRLYVNYDNTSLHLVSVKDGGLLGNNTHGTDSGTLKKNPYTLLWVNGTTSSDYSGNGVIATLTFEVDEDAEYKEYPITLSYDEYDIVNNNLQNIEVEISNGSINVVNQKIGDVNNDGKVNILDCMLLLRKIANWVGFSDIDILGADLNADGKISLADGTIMLRHLAAWVGYETLPFIQQTDTITADKMYGFMGLSHGVELIVYDDLSVTLKVPEGDIELKDEEYFAVGEYNELGYSGYVKSIDTNHAGYVVNFTDYLNSETIPNSITLKCGSSSLKYHVSYNSGTYTLKPLKFSASFYNNLKKLELIDVHDSANITNSIFIRAEGTYFTVPDKKYYFSRNYYCLGSMPSSLENSLCQNGVVKSDDSIDQVSINIGAGSFIRYESESYVVENNIGITVDGINGELLSNIDELSLVDGAIKIIESVKGKDITIIIGQNK